MRKRDTIFRIFVSMLIATGIIACGSSSVNTTPDITRPTVSATVPAANAVDVAVGSTISVTFSEVMLASSLTPSSFALTGPAGTVAGSVTPAGATATFTPSSVLANGATYTASVTAAVKDLAGNSLAAPYTWSFTTLPPAAPDTTPPTVVSTSPTNSATGVSVNAVLTVTFSETLDCSTVTASSFRLSNGGSVTGTPGCSGATATLDPSSALTYTTLYTATVTTAVTDAAGNPLANPYVWTFTTEDVPSDTTAPTVQSTSPANLATSISVSSPVTATFSEAMLASSLTTTTFLVSDGSATIAGTVSYAGTTATFTPASPLALNTTYTATITTGARDLAGNPLAADKVWSFTTEAAPSAVRILYGMNFNLYSVREDGTGRITIANSGGQEHYIGISPSGKLIYYIGSNGLWSVNADGTGAVQLQYNAGSMAFFGFSSNGRVVYGMNGDLYAINVDGTGKTTLANTADIEDYSVLMAPAGRIVYIRASTSSLDRAIYSVLDDGTGAVLLDGTTGTKTVDKVTAAGQVYYTRLNPGDSDVYVINADGTGFSAVAATTVYSEGFSGLAPDGTAVINGNLNPVGGSYLLILGSSIYDLERGGIFGITSNNKVIVRKGPLDQQDISAVNTGGGTMLSLAADPDPAVNELVEAVHPSGRVIYRTMNNGSPGTMYSVKDDGTGKVALANNAAGEWFEGISPTGRVVFATRLPSDALANIYSVNLDGTDRRTLVASTSAKVYLGFSSTGKLLYLDYQNPSRGADLFIVDHDGSAPVNLTNSPTTGSLKFFSSMP